LVQETLNIPLTIHRSVFFVISTAQRYCAEFLLTCPFSGILSENQQDKDEPRTVNSTWIVLRVQLLAGAGDRWVSALYRPRPF
jgi:hypothetical protein